MTQQAATDIDQLAINTIRCLAADMVEKANSGHPGAPMGQAAMAYALWTRHLQHNPESPSWPNRDRFVLSCGHASALLYSLLHLSGYDLSLEELQNFRQLESKTPGHPEYDLDYGVETTTGPLGQGISNAVGMAIAQNLLAGHFNRDGFPIFDHQIWVFASDGDLMEGVASEASSLAGHLGLGKLILVYDDNKISIDGSTDLAFTEDVDKRYAAYGWHVQRVDDGNDLDALDAAYVAAKAETSKPSLISVQTHIGYGSPNKQDSASSHGAPLGADEIKLTKENLGWPLEPTFLIPDETRQAFRDNAVRGAELYDFWLSLLETYGADHPDLAAELQLRLAGRLAHDWQDELPEFEPDDGPLATRQASGKVLNAICHALPELVGGSADLAGSNNTYLAGEADVVAAQTGGRNLHFGVREHAMASILNGMALSHLLIPYGGTFLIFSDYMRPAIRLAALMKLPVKYVLTHDSIFLGEDGPTHQPISQLLSLRAIPGLAVLRPAEAIETAEAWRFAMEHTSGPTALALTRQKLPIFGGEMAARARQGFARGGYILSEAAGGDPHSILIATGSEVALALEAQHLLAEEGIEARVVSLPSWELFDAQDEAYQREVLPPAITKRLAIEAASPLGWERYIGGEGATLGIDGFGASAPYDQLAEHYGFTPENVVRRVRQLLDQ